MVLTNPKLSWEQKKVLCLSSLGGVLEFYDFVIYIFLANILEKQFFASQSELIATIKTFAIFSIAFLIRPIGGIVFSHFGDRYGRKVVFFLTILFMALPSFGIAMLPTTDQIGIAAPILLFFFRIMQGLALGGEIPAAMTFVSEHVEKNQSGIATACLFFGLNVGLLLGSLITTIVTAMFTSEALQAFAWRIPFLLGGCFGIIAIFLRRYLKETKLFTDLDRNEIKRIPFIAMLQTSWRNVVQGFFLVALVSMSVILYLYGPFYLTKYMGFSHQPILLINTVGVFILSLTILGSGWLADIFGARKIYEVGAILTIVISYPLYLLFSWHSLFFVAVSYLCFSIFFGLTTGSFSAILTNLFPTSIRYSGIATSYNLAFAMFGGLNPIVCTLLVHQYSVFAPAFYLMTVASVALLVCVLGKRAQEKAFHVEAQLASIGE